jgi:hypothetical protein
MQSFDGGLVTGRDVRYTLLPSGGDAVSNTGNESITADGQEYLVTRQYAHASGNRHRDCVGRAQLEE